MTGATLTHHLNAMEGNGLLARRRDPDNRRNHIIELTQADEAAFAQLAPVAPGQTGPPWAGLIDDAPARATRTPRSSPQHED